MMKKATILLLPAALALAACGNNGGESTPGSPDERPQVIVSFYALEYAAKQVAGDHADIVNLTQPGVESHYLDLTPSQITDIAKADLVVYLSEFQPAVDDAVKQSENKNVLDVAPAAKLLEADEHAGHDHGDDDHADHDHADEEKSEGADDHEDHDHADDEKSEDHSDHDHADDEKSEGADDHEDHDHADDEKSEDHADHDHADDDKSEDHADHDHADDKKSEEADDHEGHDHDHDGHDHGDHDPHFWQDPKRMEMVGNAIAEQLSKQFPDKADDFAAGAKKLSEEMTALDKDFVEGLKECKRDEFITTHQAFGYLTDRYGLKEIGISGINPEGEPSPARIAEVQKLAKEHGVTTIFFETLTTPKMAEAIAGDLGLKTAVLDPVEGLSDKSPGKDYPSIMRANLEELKKANECG